MSSRTTVPLVAALALGIGVALFHGVPGLEDFTAGASSTASSAGPVTSDLDFDGDYFTVTGKAHIDHKDAKAGAVTYCPLDDLERATCAYGKLTPELREHAQASGRQEIDVDPAGWDVNGEVDIPALPDVTGSKAYHGWFWNRSHLVADSLGGDPSHENLVMGTRTQNVGSTQQDGQYAGGMAHTEQAARDYLDSADAEGCPLYYAATPRYTGDELIPRTVTVDIRSCNGSIDEHVEVANTAAEYAIDYTTGSFEPTR
ncbi:endonuclease [Brachybacterium endophyticum]|uniref:Endonuclease n=1 Tax=Brachybacterium endophyticum TaxID=2182385 RepID=A0A2U2RHN0_9MICO|nr:DNA/RNA non-specific endonuclease [Brachybacterium endophyticum]PWH05358.1 endonuclease [Brachybacterium endophyticum]